MRSGEQPRITPLPTADWGDEEVAALRGAFSAKVVDRFRDAGPDGVPTPTVLGTLLRHPALAGPWLVYNNVLLYEPTLDHRHRELMILRVAARTRAEYEWAQHVRLAQRLGITDDEIDAAGDPGRAHEWSPLEAALLDAADELLTDFQVTDATWARLAAHLDERQLVEVVFVVGTYSCLAMAFNSFGLQLDPELAADARPLPPT